MANIKPKKCIICGKEFVRVGQAKVCSDECCKIKDKRYLEEKNRQRAEETRKRLGTRKCVVCGKVFAPKCYNRIACGPVCAKEQDRLNRIKRKAELRSRKEVKVDKSENSMWKINERARAMGMSYGKYQLMMQMQMQRKGNVNGN